MTQIRLPSSDLLMVGLMNPATMQPIGAAPAVAFASGVFQTTGQVIVPLAGAPVPSTVTVSGPGSASRKIELSTDGGSTNGWFTPTNDASTATMINVHIEGSATHARLTGAAGDTWSVR